MGVQSGLGPFEGDSPAAAKAAAAHGGQKWPGGPAGARHGPEDGTGPICGSSLRQMSGGRVLGGQTSPRGTDDDHCMDESPDGSQGDHGRHMGAPTGGLLVCGATH